MNTIRELTQKGQVLKQRIAKLGAPYGNKNAAGPHDGHGGKLAPVGGDRGSSSAWGSNTYRTPSASASASERFALGKKIAASKGPFRLDGVNYRPEDRARVLNGWRDTKRGRAYKRLWVLTREDANIRGGRF